MGIIERWFDAANANFDAANANKSIDHVTLNQLIEDTNKLTHELKKESSKERINQISQEIIADLRSHKEESNLIANLLASPNANYSKASQSFHRLIQTIKTANPSIYDEEIRSQIRSIYEKINSLKNIGHKNMMVRLRGIEGIEGLIEPHLDEHSRKNLKVTESHYKKLDLVKKLNFNDNLQHTQIYTIKDLFTALGQKYCSSIVNLNLSDCIVSDKPYRVVLKEDDIEILSTKFPCLRHLSLVNCSISNEAAQKLGQLTNLRGLDLKGCKEIKEFSFLTFLTSLEDLSLEWCIHFKPEFLSSCLPSSLKQLNISHTNIKELEIDNALPSLEILQANDCLALTHVKLNNLSRLRDLNTSSCSHDDMKFQNNAAITNLNMSYNKKMTKIPELKNLRWLTTVNLRGCDHLDDIEGLRDSSVECVDISHCPNLENLDVLLSCPHLKEVTVTDRSIRNKLGKILPKEVTINILQF